MLLCLLAWPAAEAMAVSDAEITAAIKRMQAYLLQAQDPKTGGWDDIYAAHARHRGGESALVTFALLRSGLSAQEPEIQAATKFLSKINMNGTYAISLRAHCWAAMSDDFRPNLIKDARWLASAQAEGLFDYGPRIQPRYDNSVTQYGLLGLWESAKREGPKVTGVWRQTSKHFIDTQNPDGGWGYRGGRGSTRSMTAAGLTALLIAQERLHLGRNKPMPNLASAIQNATNWLEAEARANGFARTGDMYYLVSLERVALASGIKTLGGRDWYGDGAQDILDQEAGTGSLGRDLVDTSFALMFLSRGRTPVWANKLRLPGQVWNNRPNDLNIFTRELSDRVETELNWQVVDVESDPAHWLNAPVAYLASDEAVELSEAALHSLEVYLDLGGVLVATPDNSSDAFERSIREIASELYPGYRFKRAEADHPILGLVFPVELAEDKRPWVLSNGVRELMILAPSDWGMTLQSSRGERLTGAKELMANLHALVSDRGQAGVRRGDVFVAREAKPVRGTLDVAWVVDAKAGAVEPLAWLPMVDRLFNRTGFELVGQGVSIDQMSEVQTPLAYLGGAEPRQLTAGELRGLVKYLNGGGTVLVENIGGRGSYADRVLRQLESVFDEQAVPIDPGHPIITGEGIDGGYDCRDVEYRRYSTLNRGLVQTPRLEMIRVDGRLAVIASREDLSLGVLGSKRWGIDGYDTASARALLSNILLYTATPSIPEAAEIATDSGDRGSTIDTIEVPAGVKE